jgi:hypothetical protein
MLNLIVDYFASLTPVQIAGTVFGAIMMVLALINFISTRRSRILIIRAVTDVCSALNNFCFGSFTAGLLNCSGLCREIVFYYRGKKKWADSILWLFLFLAIVVLSPFPECFTEGRFMPILLLPAASGVFTVTGLYNKNTVVTKCCIIASQTLYTFYQITRNNPTALITSVMALVSAIIGLINEYVQRKRAAKAEAAGGETPEAAAGAEETPEAADNAGRGETPETAGGAAVSAEEAGAAGGIERSRTE